MTGKKRILIISNTYYQMIVAIRLRETIWKESCVDIIITDQSVNSKIVSEKLDALHIFNNVFWIENCEYCTSTKSVEMWFYKAKSIISGIEKINDESYDEFVFYNADIYTHGLFARLYKINKNLICSRYEEGVLSYNDSCFLRYSKFKYIQLIRKYLLKKTLEEETQRFYCFYPELYNGKLNAIKIPQIADFKEMGQKLKQIFSIDGDMLEIKEKYIFFTSVYDFEGGKQIGETDLVKEVSDIVGKDNIIVKMHPRDKRTVFKDYGIKVYNNSSIPWEAIQFNNDFSDKVFLTVNSGSVLGANMMLEKSIKSYFLYTCCNLSDNKSALLTKQRIEEFQVYARKYLKNIKVIENRECLREICL